MRQSLPAATRANALALAGLLAEALTAWEEVVADADLADLPRSNGCLYLYRRESDFAKAAGGRALRAGFGVHQEVLMPEAVAALEPGLPATGASGLYFPDSMNVTDSRPVIGPSRGSSRVIHAFGHGHLGLTLAPITVRLVAELIIGPGDPARLAAFSADRFRA
ncbi:hypothetical protein NKI79_15370 [Mesorhizobium sp. M0340]|uniref:FAD-dependent oxidoreductase n=1 Tax=Mesorhizobium sp. M0340 TaxID=2956939 RepID=UPI0033373833